MFLLFHIQYHTIEATFKIFMSINDLKISINKLHISNKLHQYIYFFWCYNCLSIFPQYINLPIKNISKQFFSNIYSSLCEIGVLQKRS